MPGIGIDPLYFYGKLKGSISGINGSIVLIFSIAIGLGVDKKLSILIPCFFYVFIKNPYQTKWAL